MQSKKLRGKKKLHGGAENNGSNRSKKGIEKLNINSLKKIGMMGNVGNATRFVRSAKHKLSKNNRNNLLRYDNRRHRDQELLRQIIPLEKKRDEYYNISGDMHTIYDQHERGRYYHGLAREVDQEINALFQQLSPELQDLLLNMQQEYEASRYSKSVKSKINQNKLNSANGKLAYLQAGWKPSPLPQEPQSILDEQKFMIRAVKLYPHSTPQDAVAAYRGANGDWDAAFDALEKGA